MGLHIFFQFVKEHTKQVKITTSTTKKASLDQEHPRKSCSWIQGKTKNLEAFAMQPLPLGHHCKFPNL
jgi:hypothetical protein